MDAENIMRIEPLKAPLDGAATVPGINRSRTGRSCSQLWLRERHA